MISRKARSSLILTIGTIVTVFGTLLLVAVASGYRINVLSGDVTTSGLVIMDSSPQGANINVAEKNIDKKTPYRIQNADIGPLQIKYSKKDYYDWNSEFLVRGGEVVFANYALMIQKNIQPSQIDQDYKATLLLSSEIKDRVFAFSADPISISEITTDFKSNKLKSISSINSNKPIKSQEPITISQDGTVVVDKLTFGDDSSAIYWLSTQSEESHNISELLTDKTGQLIANPKNPRDVFSLSQGKIYKLNVENKAITTLPMSNVSSYAFDGDAIYTLEKLDPKELGQFLVRYDANGNNRYVMYQYPQADNVWSIQLGKLSGEPIVAIHDNDDSKKLYIIRKVGNDYQSSLVGKDTKAPSFSPNGRFISFMQGNKFRTIDLEFTERFNANLNDVNSIKWLTNYQLLISRPDGLYIIDYNGYNFIKIPPNGSLSSSFGLQKDQRNVFYIDSGKVFGYSLQAKEGLINFR